MFATNAEFRQSSHGNEESWNVRTHANYRRSDFAVLFSQFSAIFWGSSGILSDDIYYTLCIL